MGIKCRFKECKYIAKNKAGITSHERHCTWRTNSISSNSIMDNRDGKCHGETVERDSVEEEVGNDETNNGDFMNVYENGNFDSENDEDKNNDESERRISRTRKEDLIKNVALQFTIMEKRISKKHLNKLIYFTRNEYFCMETFSNYITNVDDCIKICTEMAEEKNQNIFQEKTIVSNCGMFSGKISVKDPVELIK